METPIKFYLHLDNKYTITFSDYKEAIENFNKLCDQSKTVSLSDYEGIIIRERK